MRRLWTGFVVVLALLCVPIAAAETRRALLELATWGPQPQTPDVVRSRMDAAAAWFDRTTFGAIRYTEDVTPWVNVPAPASCNQLPALHAAADAAVRAAGFNAAAYTTRIYIFPYMSSCQFGGRAQFFGDVDINGFVSADLLEHELGHTLNLLHSHGTTCSVWVPNCPVDEYGDPYDMMGDGSEQFSAFGKERLGLFRSATVDRDGEYELDALELPASILSRGLVIPVADGEYRLDHRERALEVPFSTAAEDPSAGILVYHRNPGADDETLLSAGRAAGRGRWVVAPGVTYSVDGVFDLTVLRHLGTHVDVSFTWKDRVPPALPAGLGPADGAKVAALDGLVFSWTAAVDEGSGVGRYELTLDGESTALAGDRVAWAPEDRVRLGTHTWSLAIVDRAGNRTQSPRRTLTLKRMRQSLALFLDGRDCGHLLRNPCVWVGDSFRFEANAPETAGEQRLHARIDRRVRSSWQTAARRTSTTDESGDAVFTRLPRLRPGVFRITVAAPENALALASTATAYVLLRAP